MIALLMLALATAPLAAPSLADRMASVDRQQRAIWASTATPQLPGAREPALAALRRIGTTDDAAGLRAQALLLKWGSAGDAQAAWTWLVTHHRDDTQLAPVLEGWWDGSALPSAAAHLAALAAATTSRDVAATAHLLLARRDLAQGKRATALATLRMLVRTAGTTPSSLMGAGNPPRLANVARAILFQEEALAPGAPLPVITAADIDGRRIDPARWRGQTVVIDFWATWCPPCIAALPRLNAMSAADPQLRLISISGDENPSIVRQWLQRKPHLGTHLWIGPTGRVSAQWVNSAYPFYVVVGRDGRIVGTAIAIADVERLLARARG
jgi:thiol-disulfide isomerase/thioredoxin